jgi:hypothetical protein
MVDEDRYCVMTMMVSFRTPVSTVAKVLPQDKGALVRIGRLAVRCELGSVLRGALGLVLDSRTIHRCLCVVRHAGVVVTVIAAQNAKGSGFARVTTRSPSTMDPPYRLPSTAIRSRT